MMEWGDRGTKSWMEKLRRKTVASLESQSQLQVNICAERGLRAPLRWGQTPAAGTGACTREKAWAARRLSDALLRFSEMTAWAPSFHTVMQAAGEWQCKRANRPILAHKRPIEA